MADSLHQIDLCPDCDGLRSVRLDRLPGVTSVTLHGDSPAISHTGPVAVYLGPTPGLCPNVKEEAGRG
ncbi:hypothetical protein ACFY0G_32375 [Streptomyces sp. NPDC001552]|uniref:hypothetical protein n=1 Tax=Streptomyces sp. NPDC001552 TaxID=3364587 RepID=UPI0036A2D70E